MLKMKTKPDGEVMQRPSRASTGVCIDVASASGATSKSVPTQSRASTGTSIDFAPAACTPSRAATGACIDVASSACTPPRSLPQLSSPSAASLSATLGCDLNWPAPPRTSQETLQTPPKLRQRGQSCPSQSQVQAAGASASDAPRCPGQAWSWAGPQRTSSQGSSAESCHVEASSSLSSQDELALPTAKLATRRSLSKPFADGAPRLDTLEWPGTDSRCPELQRRRRSGGVPGCSTAGFSGSLPIEETLAPLASQCSSSASRRLSLRGAADRVGAPATPQDSGPMDGRGSFEREESASTPTLQQSPTPGSLDASVGNSSALQSLRQIEEAWSPIAAQLLTSGVGNDARTTPAGPEEVCGLNLPRSRSKLAAIKLERGGPLEPVFWLRRVSTPGFGRARTPHWGIPVTSGWQAPAPTLA